MNPIPKLLDSIDADAYAERLKTDTPTYETNIRGYEIVYRLLDDKPADLVRAIQEPEILKTRIKLRQGGRVATLPSFWEVWYNPDSGLAEEVLVHADPNEAKWVLSKKYGYKLATTFMPTYAKSIYEYFRAECVLDPCAGWGDRMLGATVSSCVKKYVGFDPNRALIPGYKEIMRRFGHEEKTKHPLDAIFEFEDKFAPVVTQTHVAFNTSVATQSHVALNPVATQTHVAFNTSVATQSHVALNPVATQTHVALNPVATQTHVALNPVATQTHVAFTNDFEIYAEPFEQGVLAFPPNSFDFAFTSPPYFDYEDYTVTNPKYKDWFLQFYTPLFKQTCRVLKPGTFFAIHIGDTSAGQITRFLVETVPQITSFRYVSKIGLKGTHSNQIRDVWLFQKN
jgi:hypothetical protein